MGIRGAKEVWDTLKKIHQRDNHARVQSLLAEFIKFRLDTIINEGTLKLARIQSEFGMLDQASRPSDAIKAETLLAGLGPANESILMGLESNSTASFEEVVLRLRKAEIRLRGLYSKERYRYLLTVTLARRTFTKSNDRSEEHTSELQSPA